MCRETGRLRTPTRMPNVPFTVGCPSAVIPDTLAANCRFLEGRIDHVSLVLFESRACMAYTENDLSPELASLDLEYSVHLPLDLPWQKGVDTVCNILLALIGKVDYLHPRDYVLHPPDDARLLAPLAQRLETTGISLERVLLENIEGNDLANCWPEACRLGFGACLDIGHSLAFGQTSLAELPGLWERVRMVHLYGPGPNGEHGPLTNLDETGRSMLNHWLDRLSSTTTLIVELFREKELALSLETLTELFDERDDTR